MGAVMHGSRLEHVMCLAHREISQLQHDDDVVIWGGTHDNTNESKLVSDTGNLHPKTNIHMSLQ
jgi:hypothetical protein